MIEEHCNVLDNRGFAGSIVIRKEPPFAPIPAATVQCVLDGGLVVQSLGLQSLEELDVDHADDSMVVFLNGLKVEAEFRPYVV